MANNLKDTIIEIKVDMPNLNDQLGKNVRLLREGYAEYQQFIPSGLAMALFSSAFCESPMVKPTIKPIIPTDEDIIQMAYSKYLKQQKISSPFSWVIRKKLHRWLRLKLRKNILKCKAETCYQFELIPLSGRRWAKKMRSRGWQRYGRNWYCSNCSNGT